eukprot:gene30909-38200_t
MGASSSNAGSPRLSPRGSPRISPRTPVVDVAVSETTDPPTVDFLATPGVIRRLSSSGSRSNSPKMVDTSDSPPKASPKQLGELQLSPKMSFARKNIQPLQSPTAQTLGVLKPPSPKMSPLSPINSSGSRNASPDKESNVTFKLSPPPLARTHSGGSMVSPDSMNIPRTGSSDSTPGSGGKPSSGHRKNVLMPLLPLDTLSPVRSGESQSAFVQSPPGAEKQPNKRSPIHNKMRHSPVIATTDSDLTTSVEIMTTIVEEKAIKIAAPEPPVPAPRVAVTTSAEEPSLDDMPGMYIDPTHKQSAEPREATAELSEEDQEDNSSLDSAMATADEEATVAHSVAESVATTGQEEPLVERIVTESRTEAPIRVSPVVVEAPVQAKVTSTVEIIQPAPAMTSASRDQRSEVKELPKEPVAVPVTHTDPVEEVIAVVKDFITPSVPPPTPPVIVPQLVLPTQQVRETIHTVPTKAATKISEVKATLKPDNSVSVEELHRIKEMLFGKNAVSKKSADPRAFGTGSLSIETGPSDADSVASPGKTPVGLSVAEMAAMGYSKHTGKWRGFPFDRFTCCNTNEMICPNATKSRRPVQVIAEQPAMHFSKYQPDNVQHAYNSREEPVRKTNVRVVKVSAPAPAPKRAVPRVAPPPVPPVESYHRFNEDVTDKRRSSLVANQQQHKKEVSSHHPGPAARPPVVQHNQKAQPRVRVPLQMHTNTLNFPGETRDSSYEQQMASLAVNDAELLQSIRAKEKLFIDTHDNSHNQQISPNLNMSYEFNQSNNNEVRHDQSADLHSSTASSSSTVTRNVHLERLEQLEQQQRLNPVTFRVRKSTSDNLNASMQSLSHSSVLEETRLHALQHQEVIDKALRLIDTNKQTITSVYETEFEALQRELHDVRQASLQQEQFLTDEIERYKRSVETLESTLHSTEEIMTSVIPSRMQQSGDHTERIHQMYSPQRRGGDESRLDESMETTWTQRSTVLEDTQLKTRQHQEVVDKALQLIESDKLNISTAYETALQTLQREVREAKELSLQQEEFLTEEIHKHKQSVQTLQSTLHSTEEVMTRVIHNQVHEPVVAELARTVVKQQDSPQTQIAVRSTPQSTRVDQRGREMNVRELQEVVFTPEKKKRPQSAPPRSRSTPVLNESFASGGVAMHGLDTLSSSAVNYNPTPTTSPSKARRNSPSRVPLIKVAPAVVTPWVPNSLNVRNCYNRSDMNSPTRRRSVVDNKLNSSRSSVQSDSHKRSQSAPPGGRAVTGDSLKSSTRQGDAVDFVPARDRPKSDAIPWVPSSQNVRNCYNRTDQNSPIRRRIVVKKQAPVRSSSTVDLANSRPANSQLSNSKRSVTVHTPTTNRSAPRNSSLKPQGGRHQSQNMNESSPQYRHWPADADAPLGSITSGQHDEPHSSSYSRDFLPTNHQITPDRYLSSQQLRTQRELKSMSPVFMTNTEQMFTRQSAAGKISINTEPSVMYQQQQQSQRRQSSRDQQPVLSPKAREKLQQYQHLLGDDGEEGEYVERDPATLKRLQALADRQYSVSSTGSSEHNASNNDRAPTKKQADPRLVEQEEAWWSHIQELKAKAEREGFEQAQVERFGSNWQQQQQQM